MNGLMTISMAHLTSESDLFIKMNVLIFNTMVCKELEKIPRSMNCMHPFIKQNLTKTENHASLITIGDA